MKTKLLTLIMLLAFGWTLAGAQESEPSPSGLGLRGAEATLRSEPSVSVPTEESTPANYPQPGKPLVTPKPKSSASKAASPHPSASPSPRASAASRAAATPSPSPRVTATSSSPQPAAGKNASTFLREIEKKWATAIASHDLTVVQDLLAGDYVGVTATGNVVNKAGLVAALKKDKNTYESVTNSGLDVRFQGSSALIIGTTKQKGKDASGKAFSVTYRWMDVWALRDGQWKCVGSQSIRLAG